MVSVDLSVGVKVLEKLINFRLNPLSSEGNFSDLMVSFNDTVDDSKSAELKKQISNLDKEIVYYNSEIEKLKAIKDEQERLKNLEEDTNRVAVQKDSTSKSYSSSGISVSSVLENKRSRVKFEKAVILEDNATYTNKGVSVSDVLRQKTQRNSKKQDNTDSLENQSLGEELEYSNHGISVSSVLSNKKLRPKDKVGVPVNNSKKYSNKGISISSVLENKSSRENSSSEENTLKDDSSTGDNLGSIDDVLNAWLEDDPGFTESNIKLKDSNNVQHNVDNNLHDLFEDVNDDTYSSSAEENNMWEDLAKKSNISSDSLILSVSKQNDSEETINTPKDIRDFIRKNPGVTIEYAMRFYTRKEIEANLAKGRIFKKRGKLMI